MRLLLDNPHSALGLGGTAEDSKKTRTQLESADNEIRFSAASLWEVAITEPFARVIDPAHVAGVWRPVATPAPSTGTLAALGRDLADYAAVVTGTARWAPSSMPVSSSSSGASATWRSASTPCSATRPASS